MLTANSVWHIQPYKEAWYSTENGIEEWVYASNELQNEGIEYKKQRLMSLKHLTEEQFDSALKYFEEINEDIVFFASSRGGFIPVTREEYQDTG